MSGPRPPLEPLAPVRIERVDLVEVELPLSHPLRSAASVRRSRRVLLVHVVTAEAEGWSECVAEATPTYDPETTDIALAAMQSTYVPLLLRSDGDVARFDVDGSGRPGHMARAAVGLALLDAQLRAAELSLAAWLGATATTVAPGAALGLASSEDELVAEADAAVAAGAARLRLKVTPGYAVTAVRAIRAHLGAAMPLQIDANGSFDPAVPAHLACLEELDDLGLSCIEQPLPASDLAGAAALAERLATPICLDEPLTSIDALERAVAAGACEIACLKPARLGGWAEARRFHDRCVELGVPVWVGGMLETGLGRAANAAVAALPGMALAPDLDPRGRFDPDLTDPLLPVDGQVVVPTGPGTGAPPPTITNDDARVVGSWSP